MRARAIVALLAAAQAGAAAAGEFPEVAVRGTAFQIILQDGRRLERDGLIGAVLETVDEEGRSLVIRIDGHRDDPLDPTGETVLYALSTPDPAEPAGWRNLCPPGPDGLALGFPLAGVWTADGRHLPGAPGTFGITCTAGAIGKCVRLGYRPWAADRDGQGMWAVHQACVRLLRADYCGDGRGHTRDGTAIDIADRLGIQLAEPAPGMTLEAAFGPNGAACVRRTRQPHLLDLDGLAASCPRLVGRIGQFCDAATTEAPLIVHSFPP